MGRYLDMAYAWLWLEMLASDTLPLSRARYFGYCGHSVGVGWVRPVAAAAAATTSSSRGERRKEASV